MNSNSENEPKYMISVIARMLEIHPQTIRSYERIGLITPSRSKGNTRLFSEADVKTIKKILLFTRDMGINLAGVEIILRLSRQLELMQVEFGELIQFIRDEFQNENSQFGRKFDSILVRAPKCSILRVDNLKSDSGEQ